MPNRRYMTEFAGLETLEFPSAGTPAFKRVDRFATAKADPGTFAWRLRLESIGGEECFRDYLTRFIGEVDTTAVTALIIGDCWNPGLANDDPDGVRDLLIDHAAAFPALTALFFGEVVRQETTKLSWIAQTDVSPLPAAFPGLAEFAVRGADELSFAQSGGGKRTFRLAWNALRHPELRRLTFQTHRLDPAVVRGLLGSELPALESLELYLGSDWGDGPTAADLEPLLSGSIFPALTSLALRNGQNTDELVKALATAPITRRLAELDLSLGTLSDKGARTLLDTPTFRDLRRLDLHHHYMSAAMTERVHSHFTDAGIDINTDDRQELDEEYEDDWENDDRSPAIVD